MEAFATKMGLPSPDLTMGQRGLRAPRLVATFGAASGVVLGCILGMGTLLFMDTTYAEREKKQVQFEVHRVYPMTWPGLQQCAAIVCVTGSSLDRLPDQVLVGVI